MSQARATAPAAARPLRADARRNRDRLLATATDVFAARGIEASLEEIASQAGVGIGTLYRHFPSRDALVEAVYRHQVEVLCDAAEDLLERLAPDRALTEWMERFVRYALTKRGMADAVRSAVGADSSLFGTIRERIYATMQTLLTAAAASGAIRSDVSAADLIRAMGGICMATGEDVEGSGIRLVALLMDGLRYGARP